MKVLFYCQHVLGVGHFFRSIEICKSLKAHSVTLVLGGPAQDLPIPKNIHVHELSCLKMDRNFSALSSCDSSDDIEEIKIDRKKQLIDVIHTLRPDIFLIELYPFGRKAFRFELDPAIEEARLTGSCHVICSLRDILVEKKKQQRYEERVVTILNRSFDALLVHSDETLLPLSKTFSAVNTIKIPIAYTGFITQHPKAQDNETSIREKLGLSAESLLIVASAGSGAVGYELLEAVIEAVTFISLQNIFLQVFTGPFMETSEQEKLCAKASSLSNVSIERFTHDFISYLLASDLSISMAGYNTCMNIMATGTPALMWPFSQNREQKMRAELLGEPITVLGDTDLEPQKLATVIESKVGQQHPDIRNINLNGADNTVSWLEQLKGLL